MKREAVMFEIIERKVWDVFRKKKVSFAMIYDIDGNILWHKGREISGSTINEANGFSKTYIKEALINGKTFKSGGLIIPVNGDYATKSCHSLLLESLIINQISDDYFLYMDSNFVDSFKPGNCETFMVLGEILRDTIPQGRKEDTEIKDMVGTSEAIKKIRKQVATCAKEVEPLLVTGETGTGKNYIAELIHNYSGRKGNFKIIHTPGIPESLFESELFGHKKGAFTNAAYDKKGLVEEAAGGTLLIDEISEVSIALQAKLLRFIETGKYTRLGESSEREVDVRIIAATNKDLHQAIQSKEFREDLYFRLNVFEIELPPLRERKQDLEALVREKIGYLNGKKIGDGFWDVIYSYDWPGNVRQLISVLKRAGFIDKEIIAGKDMQVIIDGSFQNQKNKTNTDSNVNNQIWNDIKGGKDFWEAVRKPFLSRDIKRSEVKSLISRGLVESGGSYKKLTNIFNLEKDDYHRFMRFLHEQDLIPGKSCAAA
jgi:transcriptional regulator with GAF, ATPase, and Fis domain